MADDLTIPIWRSVSLVGRGDPSTGTVPDVDLTSLDERRAVSRRHARIEYRDGTFYVCDLGSTNGTYVNDARLVAQKELGLSPGDRVRFARVELLFAADVAWPAGVTPEWEASTVELSALGERLDAIQGWEPDVHSERMLATVMFTDIADSTRSAASLGDARWRDLLDTHYNVVRHQLKRYDGREVRTTGDGFMATFASPASAVRCGCSVIEELRRIGMRVRVGLHTGEVEMSADDIQGIAVHIAARVAAKAGPEELMVSATLRDLVAGSGIKFVDRGYRNLKGVPGKWRLYAAEMPEPAGTPGL